MLRTLCVVSAICAPSFSFAGDLNPPPGPVAPTMKTLDEVEPRIAISDANTPGDSNSMFRITEPGSYYLTGNVITLDGRSAIELATDGVTIDLNGFFIRGQGTPAVLDIIEGGGIGGVSVRNGSLRDSTGHGIDLGDNATIENVSVTGCAGDGIRVGSFARVTGCRVSGCLGDGVRAVSSPVIRDTHVIENGRGISAFVGAVIEGCTARENATSGIETSRQAVVDSCHALANGTAGFLLEIDSIVTSCTARENEQSGFAVAGPSVIEGCVAFFNVGTGFSIGVGVSVSRCRSELNGGDGFFTGDRAELRDCVAHNNGGSGFEPFDRSVLTRCVATGHTVAGGGFTFRRSVRAVDCVARDNTYGFFLDIDSCTLVGCEAEANVERGVFVSQGQRHTIRACETARNGLGTENATFGGIVIVTGGGVSTNNTVMDCVSRGDRNGIRVEGANNAVMRNVVVGAIDASYSIAGGNASGAISNNPATMGPHDNLMR